MSSRTSSSTIFFGDDTTAASAPATAQRDAAPAASNDFRSSSRVIHPGGTGGASQIFGGAAEPAPAQASAPTPRQEDRAPANGVHTSSRVLKPGGTGGASQIQIGAIGESTEVEPLRAGKGAVRVDANASQINIGTDGARESARSSSRVLRPPGGGSSIQF